MKIEMKGYETLEGKRGTLKQFTGELLIRNI